MIRARSLAHARGPLAVRYRILRPRYTRANFGPIIVVRRGSRRLYLYNGTRSAPTSASRSGCPRTRRRSAASASSSKQRNPWWYPPDARGPPARPDPARPRQSARHALDRPVGAGVGIHGTPDPASIGYSRLARLHPHAHARGRVALRASPRSARPFSSFRLARVFARHGAPHGRSSCKRPPSRSSPPSSALLAWQVVRTEEAAGLAAGGRARRDSPRRPPSSCPCSTATRPVSLADRCAGKAVVLNFWASWCEPCKDEAPMLEQAWQRVARPRRRRPRRQRCRTSPPTRAASSTATASRTRSLRDGTAGRWGATA